MTEEEIVAVQDEAEEIWFRRAQGEHLLYARCPWCVFTRHMMDLDCRSCPLALVFGYVGDCNNACRKFGPYRDWAEAPQRLEPQRAKVLYSLLVARRDDILAKAKEVVR